MEKKFIELSLNETQAVVGGVKTMAALSQSTVNAVMVRPDIGMNSALAVPSVPSRPAISIPGLPKR